MQKKYNYIKYLPVLLIIIVLNSFQFYFSTQIPKFLADNINTGIIRQGVTKIVYPVMDEKTYNMLSNIENKELFENSYTKKNNLYELNKNIDIEKLEKTTSNNLEKIIHTDSKEAKIQMIAKSNKDLNRNQGIKYITKTSIKMLIYTSISAIFVILSALIISYSTALFSKELRAKLFNKIENFSLKNLSNIGIGSLITRTTNDINNLQNSLNMILKISISAPIALVITSWQAYNIAPSLMKVLVSISGTLAIAVIIAVGLLIKKIELMQKLIDKMNKLLREILTGKRVIRSFNKENIEDNKFKNINTEINQLSWYINKVISIINPFAVFMINIAGAFIIYYIAKLLPINNIGMGNTFAFIQYAILIMIYFILLISILFVLPLAIVSFKRVDEVLEEKIDIVYDNNLPNIDKIKTLEFKNVDFSYENSEDKILNNISFKLENNETLGIIGGTGSGKSTIIKLLLRFLDYTNGSILVNDIDIKNINLFSLRERLAYTPQTAKIFSGTILDNIAYNDKNPNIDKVKKSIELASASEFADINRDLNQAGTNLSGGQKQRISIARSIYKDSDIMLFDDSFSALDNKTDRDIRENLKNLDNMKIIVSQKISTIKNADKILVLDNGKIVGLDTHDNLLNTCNIYKELVDTQSGGAL